MSDVAVSVNGLGKRFRIGAKETAHDSLVKSILHSIQAPFRNYSNLKKLTRFEGDDETVFWALKDIDFEVKHGETLGIIGHNGAGKSTLLKILSRITEPTVGEARLNGRVSSLLEVGTGFHPDLTGRENVYMNGTILGMTRKEIDKKFDEIIDFSGVERHIDTVVKYYSSGMKVRLGFAVAAHLEPEILIVDEVLAVGDLGFQRKCLGKMNDVARSGRTVLFVSHNMAAVEGLCSKGLMLHQGKILFSGVAREAVKQYVSEFRPQNDGHFFGPAISRSGSGKIVLTSFWLADEQGNGVSTLQSGQNFSVRLGYQSTNQFAAVDVGISVHDTEDDSLLFILYSSYTEKMYSVIKGTGSFCCSISNLPLPEGRYLLKALVMENGQVADCPEFGVGYLDVLEGNFFGSGVKSNKYTRQQPKFLVNGKWD